MATWTSVFEGMLVPGETLLGVAENLAFNYAFVPQVSPTANLTTNTQGAMGFTSRRMIVAWAEGQGWKFLHLTAVSSLTERQLRADKSAWPYQAIVMVPGGMGLVVQTKTADANAAQQLSALLVQSLLRLASSRDDEGSIAALAAFEQEKKKDRSETLDNLD